MQTEYNAVDETTAIAPPSSPSVAPSQPQYGEGYDKALNSERGLRKSIEQRNKALEAELIENKRALEQSQMTLEQKYQSDLDVSRQSYQAQVDQMVAERDQKLQVESEARQVAEQRSQILEDQRAASAISSEFSSIFSQVLVNPRKVNAYMAEIADDLVVDANGQPALIVRRDENGRAVELAPISAAIGYFQKEYPEDFRPPADQKTGGGYRNLATGTQTTRGGSEPVQIDINNIDAKTFLANRKAIQEGNFEVVKK